MRDKRVTAAAQQNARARARKATTRSSEATTAREETSVAPAAHERRSA